jgi:hypothetical protein
MTDFSKNTKAELLAYAAGIIVVALIFGGLSAWFANWIFSMIIDWPVTWKNWAITWGVMIIIRMVLPKSSK